MLSITELARQMRKNPTKAERYFWQNVRDKQFLNQKFLRQYAIVYADILGKKHFFIADFYCAEHRLIVEIDGGIHAEQAEYDQARDQILEALGYQIIRLSNEEVLENRCWTKLEKRLQG